MAKIFKNFPSFIVKNGRQRQPQIVAVFVVFLVLLSQFLCLFLLVSPHSRCFMTSWNPKTAHQMRLQAIIYVASVVCHKG